MKLFVASNLRVHQLQASDELATSKHAVSACLLTSNLMLNLSADRGWSWNHQPAQCRTLSALAHPASSCRESARPLPACRPEQPVALACCQPLLRPRQETAYELPKQNQIPQSHC